VITIESKGKERNRLVKFVSFSIRELGNRQVIDMETKDLAAFIIICLEEIGKTIDISVAAWEKRGYWVKADRFRMDWIWTSELSQKMRLALQQGNWQQFSQYIAAVANKISHVKPPKRLRNEKPWKDAWNKSMLDREGGGY
jgi:hypothetical protein